MLALYRNGVEKRWAHRGRKGIIPFVLIVFGGRLATYPSCQRPQSARPNEITVIRAQAARLRQRLAPAAPAQQPALRAERRNMESAWRQVTAHGPAAGAEQQQQQHIAGLKTSRRTVPASARGATLEQLALVRYRPVNAAGTVRRLGGLHGGPRPAGRRAGRLAGQKFSGRRGSAGGSSPARMRGLPGFGGDEPRPRRYDWLALQCRRGPKRGGNVIGRVLLTTIGSLGDLHPLLALAESLRRRGHHVTYALEARLAAVVQDRDCPVVVLPGDPAVLTRYARTVYGGRSGLSSLAAAFRHYVLPTLAEKVARLVEVSRGMDAVVAPPVHPAAAVAAEVAGIPRVCLSVTPAIPSRWIDPFPYPAGLPGAVRRRINGLLWGLAAVSLRAVADGPVNQVRRQWGLSPTRDVLSAVSPQAAMNAVAVSPAFLPRPPDWPDRLEQTGFCWWDPVDPGAADVAGALFGPDDVPVVAVTAGSAATVSRPATERLVRPTLAAVRRLGVRAVVVGAAAAALERPLPSGVVALPYYPFSRLFPRCAAVVHHGGIGTTALALRAGVPSVVVPLGFDHGCNAAQSAHLGAAIPIPLGRFTPEKAARAIGQVLGRSRFRQAAETMAEALGKEDGAERLADRVVATTGI